MEAKLHPPFYGLCNYRLLSLETVVAAAQSSHDLFDVGLDVVLGILEVIIHDVLGIQAELGSHSGLGCVVDDQELVGTVVLSQVDAVRAQSELDPQLGSIGMLCTLEDGGCADLIGSAGGRDHQLDVAVAVVNDLGNAIVQEADADDTFTGTTFLEGPEPDLV